MPAPRSPPASTARKLRVSSDAEGVAQEGGWGEKIKGQRFQHQSCPRLLEKSLFLPRGKLLPTVYFLCGTVSGRNSKLLCHSSLCGATGWRAKAHILHSSRVLPCWTAGLETERSEYQPCTLYAMGVLMSKKQQVEKVQKCNAVVSAFQAGIKDRPAPVKQGEGEVEEGEVPAKPSANPDEKNTEEAEQEETDNSAGPSTSQQASATARDDCKINQEAWSRLRDGKGVEPEDLDKSHQLTPPAFVRPKREADDDQPVEVELEKKEQPPSDEMCDVCEVWTADDLYPCRICTRVFHDGCLRELGYLRAEALQQMRDTAHTVTGWSCYYCDNLNLLLTEEEMYSLMETFKQCKIIPESCLVSDELLQYRHFASKQQFDKDLTDEQEEEVLAQFAALDPEKKGHIEWSDFLYFESLVVLRKFRTENSLVRVLTAKERDTARSVFLGLGLDKDGMITRAECRQAQQSWFHKLNKDSQSCNVSYSTCGIPHRLMGLCSPMNCGISHVGPICESSPASSGSERSKTDESRPVTWADFLKESAIYILAARPNSSAMHIRLPL